MFQPIKRLALSNRRIVFYYYSYANHLYNLFLNVLPPLIRQIFLKLSLRKFGPNSLIDYGSFFRYPKKVKIGKNVEINRGFQVYPSFIDERHVVLIEDNVIIGPNVTLFGAGQLIDKNQVLDVSGDIIIRNGAYIGGNSIIRYGVEIGERSVVAAGSVVVKDVPTRYVVGGNPAKPLRSIPKF